MPTVPPESSAPSEGSNPAVSATIVNDTRLPYLVSRRNRGAPSTRYSFANMTREGIEKVRGS